MPPKTNRSRNSPRDKQKKGSGSPSDKGKRPSSQGKKKTTGQGKRRPSRANVQPPAEHAEGERLQKVLAAAGIASRREAEQLIVEGRVEVDGKVATELGVRVKAAEQSIFVDGERLNQPKRVYFAVHKPEGVVCTARDPSGRPRVTDLLPKELGRVFAVGRLDLSSEGLILLTNDGELANKLTHPRHGVRKVYEVQVAGNPTAEVLGKLRRGIHLAEGFAKPVDVRSKSRKKNSTILEMVLDEGRNREVRRLLARVGHKVQRLTRIAVGPLRLGELPRGAYRQLAPDEVRKLRAATNETDSDSPKAEQVADVPPSRRVPPARKRNAAAGKAAAGQRAKRTVKKPAARRNSGKGSKN